MADRRRVLLLGAGGFLGRHVHAALLRRGEEVTTLGGRQGRSGEGGGLDLTDPRVDLAEFLATAGAGVVVNCIGATRGDRTTLVTANVVVVARLLDALERVPARLVHLGSSAEYGAGSEAERTAEDGATRPAAPYGVTKLAATQLVRMSAMDTTVLRIFNPIGVGMPVESMPGRAAASIAAGLAAGADSIQMGDLSAWRDFVHADDVADAVALAVTAPVAPPLLNVGTGHPTQAREVVRLLAEVAGFRGEILEDAATSPRSASVSFQVADPTLAERALGWRAERSLRSAVAALWEGAATRHG